VRGDRLGEIGGALEFAAAGTVDADEIGVAERAGGPRPVDLVPVPQVAAGEPAEYRGATVFKPSPCSV
jgi:hypothetical protein